jgi:hypothetical protein
MSTHPLIVEVHAAGGMIRREGDMIELLAPRPLPADLVARIREAKPALLPILTEAADWCARHREALAYWGVLHASTEAAQLAWSELQNRWHWLHGARSRAGRCTGCNEPIGGLRALTLADSSCVHFGNRLDCLLAYGERWRREATAGLRALGLNPPRNHELAAGK